MVMCCLTRWLLPLFLALTLCFFATHTPTPNHTPHTHTHTHAHPSLYPGMARNLRQEEVAYNVGPVGPIKWMAPEALQMMSKKQKVATPQSDVYMFGITLWEMLAREHPHMTMDQNYVGNQVRLGGAYSY